MNIEKTLKKYKWYIVGGIGLFIVYHMFIRRAFIGNDPNTGIPGGDNFHLYCACVGPDGKAVAKGKMGTLIGRCVDSAGNSFAGDPCMNTGNLDDSLGKNVGIKDPGGEGTIVRPLGSMAPAMMKM